MIFPLFEGLSLSHVGRYPDFWHHTYRLAFPDSYENQVAIEVSYPVTVAALSPTLTAFPAPTRPGFCCPPICFVSWLFVAEFALRSSAPVASGVHKVKIVRIPPAHCGKIVILGFLFVGLAPALLPDYFVRCYCWDPVARPLGTGPLPGPPVRFVKEQRRGYCGLRHSWD